MSTTKCPYCSNTSVQRTMADNTVECLVCHRTFIIGVSAEKQRAARTVFPKTLKSIDDALREVTPQARRDDPDTSWMAVFELEPKYTGMAADVRERFLRRGREGFTYSELSQSTGMAGVSSSTLISKMERQHVLVRRYESDGTASIRKPRGKRRQKVMIARERATVGEMKKHVDRMGVH